ncbi:lysozyme [Aspergillus stella-maris]|uniref:lysozyme n=1 Tax=Aspergillus stella-maris TaxID=1810926 RepID=UPI003CCD8848
MKTFSLLALPGLAYAAVQGFDISNYQSNVDFAGAYNAGARFVMIKATEGTTFTDRSFSTHYTGATNANLLRGGYHYAHPDSSTGAAQATYFLSHGGGWTNDGLTLPGMLDLEAGCYGLTAAEMTSWISDFGETYKSATGRYPMLYITASWWSECTGDNGGFAEYPLVLARWASSPGTVPGGWSYQSFWQKDDSYAFGGDSEEWNGSEESLRTFARG